MQPLFANNVLPKRCWMGSGQQGKPCNHFGQFLRNGRNLPSVWPALCKQLVKKNFSSLIKWRPPPVLRPHILLSSVFAGGPQGLCPGSVAQNRPDLLLLFIDTLWVCEGFLISLRFLWWGFSEIGATGNWSITTYIFSLYCQFTWVWALIHFLGYWDDSAIHYDYEISYLIICRVFIRCFGPDYR